LAVFVANYFFGSFHALDFVFSIVIHVSCNVLDAAVRGYVTYFTRRSVEPWDMWIHLADWHSWISLRQSVTQR